MAWSPCSCRPLKDDLKRKGWTYSGRSRADGLRLNQVVKHHWERGQVADSGSITICVEELETDPRPSCDIPLQIPSVRHRLCHCLVASSTPLNRLRQAPLPSDGTAGLSACHFLPASPDNGENLRSPQPANRAPTFFFTHHLTITARNWHAPWRWRRPCLFQYQF